MSVIKISKAGQAASAALKITGSKSISNRALLIRALSGNHFKIDNLSQSDDTKVLSECLASKDRMIHDVHHAGTSFRFLTAFLSLKTGEHILTGSERMKERPIGPLVDALRTIGAEIQYLEKEAYPPLKISSFKKQLTNQITIKTDISSQFISALCMIAPVLPQGLSIQFEGDLVSRPYLDMTLKMMSSFGIKSNWEQDTIHIESQTYQGHDYTVESDWSSASYMLALVAMQENTSLDLSYFVDESLQGDRKILELIAQMGLEYQFNDGHLSIKSRDSKTKEIEYDFIEQPDMFQTVSVLAAAKNIALKARGLKTLRIKETDRITALQTELQKIGVQLKVHSEGAWEITQSGIISVNQPTYDTYKDHRMAMCLALTACIAPVYIRNPEVVSKSYPNFWEDMGTLGFVIEQV